MYASPVFAGTLTENRMTVTEGWFGSIAYDTSPVSGQLPEALQNELDLSIALTSTAFLVDIHQGEKNGVRRLLGNHKKTEQEEQQSRTAAAIAD